MRWDNIAPIGDRALVRRLKFVHDQMKPKASTENRSDLLLLAAMAKADTEEAQQVMHRAHHQEKLLKGHKHKRAMLTLAASNVQTWLDKKS